MTYIETSLTTMDLSLKAAVGDLKDVDEEAYRLSQEKNFHLTFEQKHSITQTLKMIKEIIKSVESYTQ
jgi:hypothetical protein